MAIRYTGVSASTGIALIVPATTGGHPTLWNPSGSGVRLHVRKLALSYVSGNNAPTAIEWASVSPAGSTHGTGSPIATATIVAPTGIYGSGASNLAKWSPTTNTFTAAPAYLRPTGLSLFTGVAATAVAPFALSVAYDEDEFVIAPDAAICLCTQAATTTALFQVAVTWVEVAV
jgi:hypothetical protein